MKNGYVLMREWFNFVLDNPEKATGNHTALYAWLVEINNRLKWREKFQITSRECMDGMAAKSRNTYAKCFNDLVDWGAIKVVQKSQNQYQSNVISLPKFWASKEQSHDTPKANHLTHSQTIKNTKPLNIAFDVFWDQYDKKIDLPKCQSKWAKLTDLEREAIIAYIPSYIKATPEKQYRKNPATFLNNRGWENELPSAEAPRLPRHQTNATIQIDKAKEYSL